MILRSLIAFSLLAVAPPPKPVVNADYQECFVVRNAPLPVHRRRPVLYPRLRDIT